MGGVQLTYLTCCDIMHVGFSHVCVILWALSGAWGKSGAGLVLVAVMPEAGQIKKGGICPPRGAGSSSAHCEKQYAEDDSTSVALSFRDVRVFPKIS